MAALAVTTAGDVATSGAAAAAFAAIGALWIRHLEKSGGFVFSEQMKSIARSPLGRAWNWGLIAIVGIGGTIALIVAAIMAVTGTTFR
jgi:hypothetical protein